MRLVFDCRRGFVPRLRPSAHDPPMAAVALGALSAQVPQQAAPDVVSRPERGSPRPC